VYGADLRLIDARGRRPIDGKSGVVIAEGSCGYETPETTKKLTWHQMLTDGARLTKDELARAEQFCVGELEHKVLGVDAAAGH